MERNEWQQQVMDELLTIQKETGKSQAQVQESVCKVVAEEMANSIQESDFSEILDILLTEGYPQVDFKVALTWIVDQTAPGNVEDPEVILESLYLGPVEEDLQQD